MAAKNNNKMNISYTIKALDKFTATHKKLERQLNSLERKASMLDVVDPDIKVTINNNSANRQLTQTNALLDRLPALKRVVVHVQGVGKKQQQGMAKLASNLRNIDEVLMQMGQGSIWAMLPMLGPTLAVAAGGAGALVSQLLGAGAAMGAFAMVAVPTIGYLKEMDGEVKRGSEEWKKLSKGTRDALTSLDTFRATWDKMQASFREPTLEVFALGLQAANTGLKLFLPTVEGSITAFKNLATALNENLASDDVKGIFEWLGNTGGGYLEKLGKTVGNFIVGIGNMAVAFEPLTQQFSDGFLKMSESFREWTSTLDENQAFQNFISYAAENGPILLSFIGNLINFLVQLGISMAPVGEKVLELTDRFLVWATEMMKGNDWIGKLIAGFLVFRGAISLISPIIITLTSVFRFLWPVITTVWSWIGKLKANFTKIMPTITKLWGWITKLGANFLKIVPFITRVGLTLARFASGPVGLAIQAVILIATIIYKNWDSIWKWTKDTFTKVKNWIVSVWNSIKAKWQVVTELAKTLKTKFTDMVNSVRTKMQEIKQKITDKWNEAKRFLEGIDLASIGSDIIRGLVRGISNVDVVSAVRQIGGKIKNAFTNFFSIKSPSRMMRDDVGRFITLGIVEGITGEESKAERVAERLAEAIRKPFDNMEDNYSFSAVGDARTDYAKARREAKVSEAQAISTQQQGPVTPAEAVINIGGYAAKGLITYITREQDRTQGRVSTFKGR